MTLFKISFVTTGGQKWDFDKVEARHIRETSTGYALIDERDTIIYTIPSGMIVEEDKQCQNLV